MRLLYLWQAGYPWEVRVRKITETLVGTGHEVTVLARRAAHAEPDEEVLAHGVRVLRVGGRLSAPVPGSPAWSRALDRAARRTGAEVLVVRDLPLVVHAVRAARRHRLPLVMDMAEHYPGAMRTWRKYSEGWLARLLVHRLRVPDRLERWGVPRVDLIWVVCPEQGERLCRDHGIPSARIVEVGNTPPRQAFARARRGPSVPPRLVGHHGHMTPERGLGLLIEAFARVSGAFPDLALELAGAGETSSEVGDRVRALGLGSRVTMRGRYLHSELEPLVGRIDVAVLPYPPGELVDHTLSNKIFDYMACGKPLLTSGARPMKRLMQETGAGVSFEPWTVDALVGRLGEILRRPDLATLGERGRRAFEARYHWEKDAERMVVSLEALRRRTA
jgi:glycosyltransferase involved in cell wall biosynthesis